MPTSPIFLLDYDGTLARTDGAVARCMFDVMLEDTGQPPDPEAITSVVARGLLIGRAFADLLGLAEGARTDRLAARYLELYADYDQRFATAFDGAAEALEGLRAGGARLLIVTNKQVANARNSLAHFGLLPLVSEVIGAVPGQPSKPDPRLFDERIAPLFPQEDRASFLMVGDTETDLRFARAAGIRSVWAAYGFGDPAACKALDPDYTIATLAELTALVP